MTDKLDITKAYNELNEAIEKGDHSLSLSICNKILAQYPTEKEAISSKIISLINLGKSEEAISFIKENKCENENILEYAYALYDTKKFKESIDLINSGQKSEIMNILLAQNYYKISEYEKSKLPDSFFDVAIGNIPFGNFGVNDKKYDKHNFLIHDYFIAKTLDKLRTGGVIAFVTSSGTLDKTSNEFRKYISQRADLIGAIRLPNNTFIKNANTKVTSDIIFLQKREDINAETPNWVDVKPNEDGIMINEYFNKHPEMILGKMEMVSTQFGMKSTCNSHENANLDELLQNAIKNIQGTIEQEYSINNDEIEEEINTIPATLDVKNFSYTIIDNEVYYRNDSVMIKQELPLTAKNRVMGLVKIRDKLNEILKLQLEGFNDDEIKKAQSELNNI
mgnify:CR=1 FL=1